MSSTLGHVPCYATTPNVDRPMSLTTRTVCLAACLMTAPALAAPVPKAVVKPLPDGLAGDWLLVAETKCFRGNRVNIVHTVRAAGACTPGPR